MFSKVLAALCLATASASFQVDVVGPLQTGDQLKGTYECEGCVKFLDFGLNKLIRAVEGGIPASCAALCEKAFTNSIEGEVCVGLCTLGGLYEFMNAIGTEDISPIWMCIEIHGCPQTTCTSDCAKVSNFEVSPSPVTPPGVVQVSYDITFAEGVGVVTTAAGFAFGPAGVNQTQWGTDGQAQIIGPTAGVAYKVSLTSHTEVSEGQGQNYCADAGNYTSTATVCQGQCGDKFKTSGPVLDTATGPHLVIKEPTTVQCAPASKMLN